MPNKVKIVIVEDDFLIAESLRMMIENLGYDVVDVFNSGTEVVKHFKPGFADIVMMDIELADNTNGIDAAAALKKISNPPIIFLTNNTDERIRKRAIFETNAANYLIKPYTKLDIGIAIDLTLKQEGEKEAAFKKENGVSYLLNNCIFVKDKNGSFQKIMVSDIRFLKADGSYCELIHRDNEKVIFSENLSFLESKLDFAKNLIRVHRSYIINVDHINRVQENRLWIDGEEIPIGTTYKKELHESIRFF